MTTRTSINWISLPRAISLATLMSLALLFFNAAHDSIGFDTAGPAPSESHSVQQKKDFGELPLYFVENKGQVDSRVSYYIQGSDKTLYFTGQGITFALAGSGPQHASATPGAQYSSLKLSESGVEREPDIQRWSLKLDFIGSNPDVRPVGQSQTPAVISYFKGQQSNWNSDLKSFARIVYSDLWPGIDLVYLGTASKLKYQFVIRPGADPNQIKLAYRGATELLLNSNGQLEVSTPLGTFQDDQPHSYQEIDGQQQAVPTTYALAENSGETRTYGFQLGKYDPKQPLILDPAVLVYSGYIGGSENDAGTDIAVDAQGNAYITGYTLSSEATFPEAVGPYLNFHPGCGSCYDAFVAKINPAGSELIYAGYLGGSADDKALGIAVNANGEALVTGYTFSPDFPVMPGAAFDTTFNSNCGTDAFIVRVNAAGTSLAYSTFLGGYYSYYTACGRTAGHAIAVDDAGNAYVTGSTNVCTQFPARLGPDLAHGDCFTTDGFVAKLNTSISGDASLIYCGYIGGPAWEIGSDIAVDGDGNAYVTGETRSTSGFPATAGAFDTIHNGSIDTYLVKVRADGSGFLYGTYLGGSGDDSPAGLDIDSLRNVYVTGTTLSSNFPTTPGALDRTYNGSGGSTVSGDIFIVKLNSTATGLEYSTFLGGSSGEAAGGIAIDSFGNAYLAGTTASSEATFPVINGPDVTHSGGNSGFVAKLNAAGNRLFFCGYLSSDTGSGVGGIAVDSAGAAFLTGATGPNFPQVVGPDLTYNGGGLDAFVAKIVSSGGAGPNNAPDAVNDPVQTSSASISIPVLENDTDSDGDLLIVHDTTPPTNGTIVINANSTITYRPNGGFTGDDSFTYTIDDGRGGTDVATAFVTVLPEPASSPAWDAHEGEFPQQACPAWQLNDSASPENPLMSNGKLRLVTSSNAENMYYSQAEPDISFPAAAFIEARLKYLSGTSSNSARSAVMIVFTTAPGISGTIGIGADEVFILSGDLTRGATAPVDTNGDFHTYRIEITSGTSITVFQDGTQILTGSTYSATSNGPTRVLFWGEISGLATGASEWEFVRHNLADCRSCATPSTGLMSWWSANDHSLDLQDGNTANRVNGTLFSQGRAGDGFSFDGSDDYVDVPETTGLDVDLLTVEMWIRPTMATSSTVAKVLVDKRTPGLPSDAEFAAYVRGNGDIDVGVFTTGTDAVFDGAAGLITMNVWTHVAFTWDGSLLKVYRNGGLIGTAAGSGTVVRNAVSLKIGARYDLLSTEFFLGSIDEISMYNRPLLASEISAVFNAGSSGKCHNCSQQSNGLSAWWRWEGNGVDSQGGDNVTLNGSPVFSAGTTAQALQFDGVDDYARASASSDIDVGAGNGFTIEAWVDPSDIASGRPILEWNNPAGPQQFGVHFWITSGGVTGNLFANINDTSGNSHIIQTPIAVMAVNVYQHVALTYDKTTGIATIYRNGLPVQQQNLGTFRPQTTFDLYIGLRPTNGVKFVGRMDEVSLYNRALASSEIQSIVKADVLGRCLNLPPDAIDDSAVTDEDVGVTIPVISNDSDANADSLDVTDVTQGSHGYVVNQGGGFLSYTPDPDFNGVDSFAYTISDGRGGADTATVNVTVRPVNDPPAAVDDTAVTQEDTPATINVLANDSDPEIDTLAVTSLTQPTNGTAVLNPNGTITYAPNADFNGNDSFTYRANDGQALSSIVNVTIVIIPVDDDTIPPTATALLSPQPNAAGWNNSNVTVSLTAMDNADGMGLKSVTYSASGAQPIAPTTINAPTTSISITVEGTTIVTFFAQDNAGNFGTTQTITVKVDKTKPVVTPPANAAYQCVGQVPPANAGDAVVTDNLSTPPVTLITSDNGGTASPSNPLVISRSFAATDLAGNSETGVQTITVIDNMPPVVTCPADITVEGNNPNSCSANVNPGVATGADNCSLTTIAGSRSDGLALNAPYALGSTTINWTATDSKGNSTSCQQRITVTNPPPQVMISGPLTGAVYAVDTPVSFTGSFTDNPGGTHTATWNFDSTEQPGVVNESTGAVTASYTFPNAGVYKVTLTVIDGCGGTGSADSVEELTALVVIYDPDAGFVTGGGWINSPAGSYSPNPSLTGKANFGFVSKYHNGATIPTGNTEFQFKAGNMNFSSTSYEWLVVAGRKAQYKGFGTINGSGNYRFMLTAIDGQQPGGGDQDKIRIRIWSDSGGLVYDNQLNAPDTNDPTTVLGGGSIVIHK